MSAESDGSTVECAWVETHVLLGNLNAIFYLLNIILQINKGNPSSDSQSTSSDSDPLSRGPIAGNLSQISSPVVTSPETPPVQKRYVWKLALIVQS